MIEYASRLAVQVCAILLGCVIVRADELPSGSNAEMEDAIRALLVASPYHISDAALAGTIRYRLALEDGLAWTIPETGEQHVERRGDEIELTICATCGHEAPPADADLHRYLEPNAWVQSRDPRVIGFANAAMGHSVDLRMRGLVRAVQMHMTGAIDFANTGPLCRRSIHAVATAPSLRYCWPRRRVRAGFSNRRPFQSRRERFPRSRE